MAIYRQAIGCDYTILENNIHKFVFTGEGDSGMDELFAYLEKLWSEHDQDETLRYIVDTTRSDGQTSMMKLLERFRQLEKSMDQRPAGRTAIIHKPDALISLADSFIRTFAPSRDKTRFFKSGEDDKALQWVSTTD